MDEDRKFQLEQFTREKVDEAATRVGLYMQEWQVIDPAEAERRASDLDGEIDHVDEEAPVFIVANFMVGDLALAPHVLDPDKNLEDELLAGFEVDIDHDSIIDALSPGGILDEIEQLGKRLEDE